MPYNKLSELPENVSGVLPTPAQKIWMSAFNSAFEKYGEDKARRIAWSAVKKRFKKKEDKWVAKIRDTPSFKTVKYVFEPKEAIIGKEENGYSYLEYILSGNEEDLNGQRWSDFALKRFAEQINEEGLKGYMSDKHTILELAKQNDWSPDQIEEMSSKLDTGIEAFKARYDNGQLVSNIKVPSELVDVVKNMGISVEARVPTKSIQNNTFNQGRLTSFIFTNNPAYSKARAV